MGSQHRLTVDASEKKPAVTNGNKHPRIVVKFCSQNKTEDKTLVLTNGNASTSTKQEDSTEGIDGKAMDQDQTLDKKDSHCQLGFVQKENKEQNNKKRIFSTFSVSLSRERIEGDLISMGLSKRTKRPKKRPLMSVKKKLDDLFPALRLKSITPDRYKVLDI